MKRNRKRWLQEVFAAAQSGKSVEWAVVEWFCSDAATHIGVFESVGQPIHRHVFRDLDTYLSVHEAILALPDRSDIQLVAPQSEYDGEWLKSYVRKGLYVFCSWEGADWGKQYRLLASPTHPLHIHETSEVLVQWLSQTAFEHSRFERQMVGESFKLSPQTHLH